MPTYHVAISGCGGIVRAHAMAWQGVSPARIVAVSNIAETARTACAAQFVAEIEHAADHDMLTKEKPEVVSVRTRHIRHGDMIAAAARPEAQMPRL